MPLSSQWGLGGILAIAVALLLVGSVSASASGKAAMKANGLIAFDDQTSNQTWVMKADGRAQHLFIQYGVRGCPARRGISWRRSRCDVKR